MSSFIWGIVWFTVGRTWIAICMNSRRSYLKQIGQKGSKVCQKHVMQISLILSPNYLLNVPPDARKGKLLMNVANEEGGEVSWSLAWRKSGNSGTRRAGRDTADEDTSQYLRYRPISHFQAQICSRFQVIGCRQVFTWKLKIHPSPVCQTIWRRSLEKSVRDLIWCCWW